MPTILETTGLSKRLSGRDILQNVNLHVRPGEIYGFLGPNGAGKSTAMKLITNLWKPTQGSISLFSETLTPQSYHLLKRLGSVIEFPTFYEHLSGAENLALHCQYMGYHSPGAIEDALALLQLTEAAGQPVRGYSLGMKQRLGIARAVLSKPELLILDEPTNGLDPAGMKQIRTLLQTLCREYGMTIFVSSHILSEVESIAHTIGILHRGKLLKEISMEAVWETSSAYLELSVLDSKRAAYLLSEMPGLGNFKLLEQGTIRIYEPGISPQEISQALSQGGAGLTALVQQCESLEDYFLKLTEEVQ